MSLSMIVELLYASRIEARLIVGAARRAGAAVRLVRWGHHACVGPIAAVEGAHDALTDQADWNAPTWDMDPEKRQRLAVDVETLYAASKLGVTVRAIWPPDEPERFEHLTIAQMLAIIRGGAIGTRTVYVVMGERGAA